MPSKPISKLAKATDILDLKTRKNEALKLKNAEATHVLLNVA